MTKQPKQSTAQETAIEDAMTLISALELPYLVELSQRLDQHIKQRRKDDVANARRQIEIIAQQVGMTVDALIEIPISGINGTRPPQFVDPDDPARTWSGHGRKPYWVRDLESQGVTLDQLRIAGTDTQKDSQS
jgi:DNA-binding protein H-NS